MRWTRFLIAAFVAFATAIPLTAQRFARRSNAVNQALLARAQQITGDRFTVATSTPHGVNVVARSAPRPEVLRAIDNGFSELFTVAARHGYRSGLSFHDYTVFKPAPIEHEIAAVNTHPTSLSVRDNTPAVSTIKAATSLLRGWCWRSVRRPS